MRLGEQIPGVDSDERVDRLTSRIGERGEAIPVATGIQKSPPERTLATKRHVVELDEDVRIAGKAIAGDIGRRPVRPSHRFPGEGIGDDSIAVDRTMRQKIQPFTLSPERPPRNARCRMLDAEQVEPVVRTPQMAQKRLRVALAARTERHHVHGRQGPQGRTGGRLAAFGDQMRHVVGADTPRPLRSWR